MRRIVDLLVLVITALTICLYLGWMGIGFNIWGTGTAILIFTALISFYFKQKIVQGEPEKKLIPGVMAAMVGLVIIAVAVILSPYIKITTVNGFEFVGFSSVTDMFKHSYVVTTISNYGIPPKHPYFLPANFSYYYGYYLIPSLLSSFWKSGQNYILYGYILATDLTALLILVTIIKETVKNNYIKLLTLALVLFGIGWDIIPMTWSKALNFPNLIEMWAITNQSGLRVDNLFTALLWTPQHFLAAAIGIYLIYRIYKSEIPVWQATLMLVYIALSSVFVALSVGLYLLLIFIGRKETRKLITITGLSSLGLLMPYLAGIIGKGGDLFENYIFKPFPFTSNTWLNIGLSGVCEYGIIVAVMMLFVGELRRRTGKVNTILIILAVYLPIVITWFVRSKGYNDFALRGVIISQLTAIGVMAWLADREKRWGKLLIITIMAVNLVGSMPGFLYEYASRWKTRGVLDPYESELVLALRKDQSKEVLAMAGKDEWIFKTPPLAFTPIMTSDLYDSGAYISDTKGKEFGHYEELEKNIYFRQNHEKTYKELIDKRNKYLEQLPEFINNWEYDWVVLDKRMGVKSGVNFWSALFDKLGITKEAITPVFGKYKRKDLINKLEGLMILIDEKERLEIKVTDNKVRINQGFWYAASCENDGRDRLLRFEPEDQYVVYEDGSHGSSCVGNLFYAPRGGEFKLIGDPGELILAPVKIIKVDR